MTETVLVVVLVVKGWREIPVGTTLCTQTAAPPHSALVTPWLHTTSSCTDGMDRSVLSCRKPYHWVGKRSWHRDIEVLVVASRSCEAWRAVVVVDPPTGGASPWAVVRATTEPAAAAARCALNHGEYIDSCQSSSDIFEYGPGPLCGMHEREPEGSSTHKMERVCGSCTSVVICQTVRTRSSTPNGLAAPGCWPTAGGPGLT